MRLVFAGTPSAAVPTLRRLATEHDVAAVVTRPDAPLGRKRVLTPSPVAQVATELGLPVIKAARLDAEATDAIAALGAELGVIVAYGGLVREPLLSTPAKGCLPARSCARCGRCLRHARRRRRPGGDRRCGARDSRGGRC